MMEYSMVGRGFKMRPAVRKKPHCSYCKNHKTKSSTRQHNCPYKEKCKCVLCVLTHKAQVIMCHQQRVWRFQNQKLSNEPSVKGQKCDNCRNHSKYIKKSNHECPFKNCDCRLCKLTFNRRIIMKYIQRARRLEVTLDSDEVTVKDDVTEDVVTASAGSNETTRERDTLHEEITSLCTDTDVMLHDVSDHTQLDESQQSSLSNEKMLSNASLNLLRLSSSFEFGRQKHSLNLPIGHNNNVSSSRGSVIRKHLEDFQNPVHLGIDESASSTGAWTSLRAKASLGCPGNSSLFNGMEVSLQGDSSGTSKICNVNQKSDLTIFSGLKEIQSGSSSDFDAFLKLPGSSKTYQFRESSDLEASNCSAPIWTDSQDKKINISLPDTSSSVPDDLSISNLLASPTSSEIMEGYPQFNIGPYHVPQHIVTSALMTQPRNDIQPFLRSKPIAEQRTVQPRFALPFFPYPSASTLLTPSNIQPNQAQTNPGPIFDTSDILRAQYYDFSRLINNVMQFGKWRES